MADNGHDHGAEGSGGMSLIAHQLGGMVVLTLVGICSVLLPYVHPAIYKNKRLIDVVSAFGGGTFLALGLFHLLPESTENIQETGWFPKAASGHHYPISYFLAFGGFAFILFCEKVIFSSADVEFLHFHDHGEGHSHSHGEDHSHSHTHESKPTSAMPSTGAGLTSGDADDHYHAHHDEHDHHHHDHDHHDHDHSHDHEHVHADDKKSVLEQKEEELKVAMSVRGRVGSLLKAAQIETRTLPHNHARANGSPRGSFLETVGVKQSPNELAAYCMMIALSVHNTFEGMVVGTVRSPQTLWMLVSIVTAHHWVAGVALAMGFIKQNIERTRAYAALAIFVFSLPLGQAVGMWIAAGGPGWSGIFNAIAAGTILYVATCEIIAEEFAMGTHRRSKFVAFLLGALLVAGLTVIHVQVGHGDSHDHNHDHDHNGHNDHSDIDVPGHDHDHDHHDDHDHDHNHDDHSHDHDDHDDDGGDDGHDHNDHFNLVPPPPKPGAIDLPADVLEWFN